MHDWYVIPKDSNYLMHHGIMGQKWGKKNGPPYPLDSSVSTGKRLKDRPDTSSKEEIKAKKKADRENRKAERYRKREINKRNLAIQKELWENSSFNEYGMRVYTQKASDIDKEIQALKRMDTRQLKNVKKLGKKYVNEYVEEMKESKKAAQEKRWEDYWSYDVNHPEYAKIQTEIKDKSVDWYFGEGKTKAQKRLIEEERKLSNRYDNDPTKWNKDSKFRKEREVIYDKVMSNVLKDIGLPDTEDNRKKYKYLVFGD